MKAHKNKGVSEGHVNVGHWRMPPLSYVPHWVTYILTVQPPPNTRCKL